jgi:hypothetical protein
MPVTIKVNGSNLSLAHKGSEGVSTATLPDVCKTPSAGNVPIPYPNVSMSRDLAKGTTTVTADGGNMIAIKGSEFSRSTGDEPGTTGGVKSSTFIKESTWILYSFDVKMDGANACRLTDKMFQNHANTLDAAGLVQLPVNTPPSDPACAKLYEAIFELLYGVRPTLGPGGGRPMGTKGMAFRWEEYAENRGGWTEAKSATHMNEYIKQQTKLKDLLQQWRNKKKRNCDDKDLPPGADAYATQAPELGPGKPLAPAAPSSSPSWITSWKENMDKLAKALGVSIGVVIGVEIVTRIIRLWPPLWPTELSPV